MFDPRSADRAIAATREEAFSIAAIILLVLWFCQDLVVSNAIPFFRDLSTYFYPLRFTLFEAFRSGEVPLWNRRMAAGFPVLADFQSGTFYPPHLLFVVLPFFTAIRLLFVFHFLIAATGAYKLFRLWSYPCYLSILGALLFTFGGTVVSLSNLLNHFQTAVWLPWIILFWEKAVRAVSWKTFLTFSLALTVQFLAGSPELFVLSLALVVVDGLRVKNLAREIPYGRMVAIFAFANLSVVALTMMQLLPTAELYLESRRLQPIPPQEALYWSLKPQNLLNLFFLDKEIDPSVSVGIRFFFSKEAAFFVSYYSGALVLFGICLWLCSSSLREKVCLLGLVFGSLLLAFGSYTPVYPFLFRQLPILGAVRYPEKFFFFTYALLVYMAMKGLAEALQRNNVSLKKITLVSSGVCVAWIAAYVYLRSDLTIAANFIAENATAKPSSAVHSKMVAAVLANLERQLILSVAFLLLFALAKSEKIRHSLFAFMLVSAAFVDLSWAHRGFLFPVDPDFVFKSPRVLHSPDSTRFFYYPSSRNLHPSFFVVQGQPPFKEAAALVFQNLLPNEGVFYGFDYFQEIDALARRPYTEFLVFANQRDTAAQIKLLRAFNVGYLVSFKPLEVNGITLVGHFPQNFSWLYKVDRTIPRVYVVNRRIVEKNAEQALGRIASTEFDPTQEVVLDTDLEVDRRSPLVAAARIVHYEHQAVTVHASLNNSGILVLADSYYPGWKAYVDGKKVPIVKANHFFRAVPLTQGQHLVEFKYEPRSFRIGLIISLFTIVSLVMISATLYIRNYRRAVVGTAA